jgi:hypothetical protein
LKFSERLNTEKKKKKKTAPYFASQKNDPGMNTNATTIRLWQRQVSGEEKLSLS